MSKIYTRNRMGKGNVTGVKASLLNRARSELGIIPQPTATTTRSPSPSPAVKKPKPKRAPPTITIPAKKPKGVSDAAWKIISKNKLGK